MPRVTQTVGKVMGKDPAEAYMKRLLGWSDPMDGRRRPYASSIAFCPRQNTLMSIPYPGETNDFGPESAIYMGIGNGVEEFMYRRMVEEGRAFASNQYLPEIPEYDWIDIGGKIDVIGFDHNDDVAIWEVKTCGRLPSEPKLSHLRQLQTYSIFGGFDNAYLIYYSRSVMKYPEKNFLMRVFKIDTSRSALEFLTAQVMYTFKHLNSGTLADKGPGFRKSSECYWCAFKDICYGSKESPLPYPEEAVDSGFWQESFSDAAEYWDSGIRDALYLRSLKKAFKNAPNKDLKGRIKNEIDAASSVH